jgi:outer membrane protein assembly factor BamD
MSRRILAYLILAAVGIFGAGCHKNKSVNPIANLDSKQPDKVLFDRAMDALKHNKFDVARITLQTLINTYPDSEYIARAKLGVADSWYTEGGTTGLAQAEVEYKDFQTFFPNLPEAAEAQLKVAGIHYRQMEKPDRDFTHAKRAEDEYRQLIQQYPDSKLVPEAKQKLLQVQEVLAEREFRIGRFYLLRESWPAAAARLKSLTDAYPLYSQADEALYLLGQAYEGEMNVLRAQNMPETVKSKLLGEFTKSAASAYSKIITRYPAMERVGDAKNRLKNLNQPIPTPSPEALAQNKAEEASRGSTGRVSKVMTNFNRHPDMARAASGPNMEPALQDPQPTNATDMQKDLVRIVGEAGGGKLSVETVKGNPGENQPVPRSEAPSSTPEPTTPAPATLTTPPDPSSTATKPAPVATSPVQVNDAAPAPGSDGPSSASSGTSTSGTSAAEGSTSGSSAAGSGESSSNTTKAADDKTDNAKDQQQSSSKKKKKKGLGKLNPF